MDVRRRKISTTTTTAIATTTPATAPTIVAVVCVCADNAWSAVTVDSAGVVDFVAVGCPLVPPWSEPVVVVGFVVVVDVVVVEVEYVVLAVVVVVLPSVKDCVSAVVVMVVVEVVVVEVVVGSACEGRKSHGLFSYLISSTNTYLLRSCPFRIFASMITVKSWSVLTGTWAFSHESEDDKVQTTVSPLRELLELIMTFRSTVSFLSKRYTNFKQCVVPVVEQASLLSTCPVSSFLNSRKTLLCWRIIFQPTPNFHPQALLKEKSQSFGSFMLQSDSTGTTDTEVRTTRSVTAVTWLIFVLQHSTWHCPAYVSTNLILPVSYWCLVLSQSVQSP